VLAVNLSTITTATMCRLVYSLGQWVAYVKSFEIGRPAGRGLTWSIWRVQSPSLGGLMLEYTYGICEQGKPALFSMYMAFLWSCAAGKKSKIWKLNILRLFCISLQFT
jgi:hypothetical protein